MANRIMPPESVDCNIFEMSAEQKAACGIEEIPGTLIEALYAMEEDALIKDVLGAHTYTKYIAGKKEEWNRYRSQVTDWEIGAYLNNF